MNEQATLFTIGHSNHALEHLLGLLGDHQVEAIGDVRSWPASRHTPWFDRGPLRDHLRRAGMKYVFLGRELGGRPDNPDLYTDDGRVRYDRVAATESFAEGLEKLRTGILGLRIAIMCAEENPENCHRRLLVARVLFDRGVRVLHIRGDGTIQQEHGYTRSDGLFDEPLPWTSTASVSRRRRPSASLSG